MSRFRFSQINVFSADPLSGNPVAVIHGADSLSEKQMFALARWTNLSETTFLLQPDDPAADYRLRIFSPGGELPFAGHPTLGSCHAWLSAGGKPGKSDVIVQQCEAGLISIRREGSSLAFAAPPLVRSGPLEEDVVNKIANAFGLPLSDIVRHQWVDNGPGWCAIMLRSAQQVLSLKPDWAALSPLNLGVVGLHDSSHEADIEVRAFVGEGGYEDPVTGSLNASLAQWLMEENVVKSTYLSAQGTMLQRAGRIHLHKSSDTVWVAGEVVKVIDGEINL
ncbi:PhzF family phenazine biosynthesis protein [Pseudohongiella nitratireducens]|uniref:PhzF family phenazine biosynthesis protein n=1 Tax=Pseudohongiella nitratireducens TaxID=1768907 RepID=UPI00240A4661|nr:PhzF family phenazine biosynthesis protein [Pseudohongiella nitratireducens]MDF1623442.1 PhzF family phenazine biosynthesis protein [Pseudohongiella nitratireducens]|tara:strand:+ start:2405 stop:3238 length:834 start_codon:yes stop_codon:yes gene_type:complete